MNWDQIEGNWQEFGDQAKQQWDKLTDEHLSLIAGKRDVLISKIQEIYGVSKDEANKQLINWQQIQKKMTVPSCDPNRKYDVSKTLT